MSEAHLEDLADRIHPRSASNMLLWTILAFVAVFVVWASVVRLDRTIHAAGRIVPSSRLQVLSNLEGGVVSAILVHPGDQVAAGQALVRIDQTETSAQLGSSEITVAALSAKTTRLEAEMAGREPGYATSNDPVLAEQIGVERSLHAARMSDLASLSAAASARERQAKSAVVEARAVYRSRSATRDSAHRQLELIRPLVERGIEPQMTLVQLQSAASVAAADAAQAEAAIGRAQSGVAEAQAALVEVRQGWRAQAGTDLAAAQAEMSARRRSVPALAAKVRRSVVVASLTGRVNRVLVSTVGASVAPGAPIVEVVPSGDALTVEAMVNPKDIAAVRIGQRAKINVTAYESAIYGGMDGKVVSISPDVTIEERTGESHYTVRVRGNAETFRDASGRRLQIGPGMTADVNLIGEKRSVMAYILTPITRLAENAARE